MQIFIYLNTFALPERDAYAFFSIEAGLIGQAFLNRLYVGFLNREPVTTNPLSP